MDPIPRAAARGHGQPCFDRFSDGGQNMARSTKLAKLEATLKNARRRARNRKQDPITEAAFAVAGGAGVALMADNNIKLPIPGVPNSLQVALTALLVNKFIKPKGIAKDLINGVQNGGAAIYGYGLAKKWKNPDHVLAGDDDYLEGYIGDDGGDNLQEG